jgi:hypothetical protein
VASAVGEAAQLDAGTSAVVTLPEQDVNVYISELVQLQGKGMASGKAKEKFSFPRLPFPYLALSSLAFPCLPLPSLASPSIAFPCLVVPSFC